MDGGSFKMSTINHGLIFKTMEKWAPKHLAYDWDPIGLQVGSTTGVTKKVMITLDVLESVVDEAIEKGVNLIIAHHPLLFRPLNKIDVQSVKGKVVQKLIANHITVYAAHTNLDIAPNGVNDMLMNRLGITSTKSLVETHHNSLVKLVVFVPESHASEVRHALGEAGAGHIGNYSHCTFQTKGKGTFMPQTGSTPFIGKENEMEFVDEVKIETIVQENNLSTVLTAMNNTHPYEEVAYDIIPLKQKGETYGLGRIGSLKDPIQLRLFAEKVKEAFHTDHVRVVGALDQTVRKIAILGGSGEKYISHAKRAGADVFITGDTTFHHAQDAMEMGLALIDSGHYVEEVMKQETMLYLQHHFANLPIIESETNTNPYQFV